MSDVEKPVEKTPINDADAVTDATSALTVNDDEGSDSGVKVVNGGTNDDPPVQVRPTV